MEILDVSQFYSDQGGGVRTYTNQKLAAAAALGHELVVVAPAVRAGEERRFGGRVVWVESRASRSTHATACSCGPAACTR